MEVRFWNINPAHEQPDSIAETTPQEDTISTTMKALVADGKGNASVQEVEKSTSPRHLYQGQSPRNCLEPDRPHQRRRDRRMRCSWDVGSRWERRTDSATSQSSLAYVESQGANFTHVEVGDRIAGLVHRYNSYSPREGGFAQYAEIGDGIFAHIPESWIWAARHDILTVRAVVQAPRLTWLIFLFSDDVEIHFTSGYSVFGETSIKYGKVVEGEPAECDVIDRLGCRTGLRHRCKWPLSSSVPRKGTEILDSWTHLQMSRRKH